MKKLLRIAGRVLLIAVGAFFLLACLVGLYAIPKAVRTLDAAVLLDEPIALPENEGKLVILQGELSMLEPATCPKLGLTFDSPVVNRYSESFSSRYKRGKRWRDVNTIPLTGRAAVGDFEIDPDLLALLDAKTDLHELDLPDGTTLYTVVEDGITYISEDDIRGVKEGLFLASAGFYWRYHYTSLDISEPVTVTLVGYQQNGRLLLCDDVDNTAAHLGAVDPEGLRETLLREEWITFAVAAVIAVVCLFFGFKGILYLKPKLKATKKDSPKRNKRATP